MKFWISSTTALFNDWMRPVRDIACFIKTGARATAQLIARGLFALSVKFRNIYHFECWGRPDGCECVGCHNWKHALGVDTACRNSFLRWAETVPNQTFTAGVTDLLAKYFAGSSYTAHWYVFLVDGVSTPTFAAGDTSSGHLGWTENTGYSAGTRPALVPGAAAAGSIDNSGSPAAFSVNTTVSIAGAGLANSNTKSSTTDLLYGAAAFSTGTRPMIAGDTLNVTITLSAS